MMPHSLKASSRPALERWALQHFRNEVWRIVRDHDPGTLPETTIQGIERRVLAGAETLISRLSDDCLRDARYMNIMIGDVAGEAEELLRKKAAEIAWREQWKDRGRRSQD